MRCHYLIKDDNIYVILRHFILLNSGLTTVSTDNDTFISGYTGSDEYIKLIDEEYQYHTLALKN